MLDATQAGLTSRSSVLTGGGDELAADVRYVTLVVAADVTVLAEHGSRLQHNIRVIPASAATSSSYPLCHTALPVCNINQSIKHDNF